jgi:hypothetical protein
MRELGSRGGKARRAGFVEQLPKPERESLRHHLRAQLDHDVILAAAQQTLAGGNESARVQCIPGQNGLGLRETASANRAIANPPKSAAHAHGLASLRRERGRKLARRFLRSSGHATAWREGASRASR